MEKNKVNFIVYVLMFCVVIAGIGGFYLGKSFGEKTVVEKDKPTETDKTDDNKKDETDKDDNKDDSYSIELDIDKWDIDEDVKTTIKMMKTCYLTKEESLKIGRLTENLGECNSFYYNVFENGNQLQNIAGFLMMAFYNLDYTGLTYSEGYYAIVDEKGFNKTKEYFNVTLDKFDDNYYGNEEDVEVHNYINKGYYLANSGGDGCGCEAEIYNISDVKKENGNYIVSLDMHEVNLGDNNASLGDIIGSAELSYTYKNNHIYYNYFNVTRNSNE